MRDFLIGILIVIMYGIGAGITYNYSYHNCVDTKRRNICYASVCDLPSFTKAFFWPVGLPYEAARHLTNDWFKRSER